MPSLFWLYWLAAFLIVVSALAILCAIRERWLLERSRMTAEDRMTAALRNILICAVILILVFVLGIAKALSHDPAHHELDQWYANIKQPDTGISCCGPSDAYFCDEAAKGQQVICIINDDRDNAELKRIPIPNGTIIEIPQHKINKDPNPTGRAVVWLSSGGFVWCFVGISGS